MVEFEALEHIVEQLTGVVRKAQSKRTSHETPRRNCAKQYLPTVMNMTGVTYG